MDPEMMNNAYPYIDSVRYNEFELKEAVYYGNGTKTFYKYDILQRLINLQSYTATTASPSELMQNIDYTYDAVSNITDIDNSAGILANGLGGMYHNQYSYDNLYRLVYSTGNWLGSPNTNYELEMSYNLNGRIGRKTLTAGIVPQTPMTNSFNSVGYDNMYHYTNASQPNTLTYIDNNGPQQFFQWDAKGNMTYHKHEGIPLKRYLCWDEQNRLQGVMDDKSLSVYQYDANGERTYKLTGDYTFQNVSGTWRYFYHPDHLGSSSWITFSDGKAVEHLHYLPWGEDFVDQRTGSFSSMYTFSAKEKDTETGYSYFGSRYYNSDLSIWLSVDPMSDKYPSLSPYVYCANNPVKLVDPNGEEVYIDGNEKNWALEKLSSTYKNLNLSLDGSGKLQFSIDEKTKLSSDEKHLLKAIKSTDVSVHLTANKENKYSYPLTGELLHSDLGGAFMGNALSEDGKSVNTYQFVSRDVFQEVYFSSDIGGALGHEITESYHGGLISINKGEAALPAKNNKANEIYDLSHARAITCPLTKEVQRYNYWAEKGIDYNKLKPLLQPFYGKSFGMPPNLKESIVDYYQFIDSNVVRFEQKEDDKTPPPSIYDSIYSWPYQVVGIEFMPTGAYSMYNLKDYYLIEVIDTTKTFAYTIISFCDEALEFCTDPIEIGMFYNLTLFPLEKKSNNTVGGCYDRIADVIVDNIHVKIYPPAKIYLLVSARELKEIYYQQDFEYDNK